MIRTLIIAALAAFMLSCSPKQELYLIETDHGTMTVKLYDSTPKHRDNFKKLVNDGFYDDLLFHRVIKGFMIQGGDPKSKGACLLYTSPSPRDQRGSRMPSSA